VHRLDARKETEHCGEGRGVIGGFECALLLDVRANGLPPFRRRLRGAGAPLSKPPRERSHDWIDQHTARHGRANLGDVGPETAGTSTVRRPPRDHIEHSACRKPPRRLSTSRPTWSSSCLAPSCVTGETRQFNACTRPWPPTSPSDRIEEGLPVKPCNTSTPEVEPWKEKGSQPGIMSALIALQTTKDLDEPS